MDTKLTFRRLRSASAVSERDEPAVLERDASAISERAASAVSERDAPAFLEYDAHAVEPAEGVSASDAQAVPDVKINRVHPRPSYPIDMYTQHRPYEPPRRNVTTGVDSAPPHNRGVTLVSHPRAGNTEAQRDSPELSPSSSGPVAPPPRHHSQFFFSSEASYSYGGVFVTRRQNRVSSHKDTDEDTYEDRTYGLKKRLAAYGALDDDSTFERQSFREQSQSQSQSFRAQPTIGRPDVNPTRRDAPQSAIHDSSAVRRSVDYLNTLTSQMLGWLPRHPTVGYKSASCGPQKTDYLAQILVSLCLHLTFELVPVYVGIGVVGLMLPLFEKLLRWALGSMRSPRGGSYRLFDLLETIRVVRWYHANVCLMLLNGYLLQILVTRIYEALV